MSPNPTDQKWSWVIALACCFINCLLYGITRLSGLLLVSTVETFEVTRARAAIPFSVSTSVRNLSGIFVGYFGQKFGLRAVIFTGCILASLGAGLCFFVSDILWMTICWGGIFGIGCGLATCLLPLAINQHFDKHRGKASGISYSGSYIGSFIFPPVVVQLLDKYGLPGTFLVISSTLLNGLAASLLFHSPSSKSIKKNHLESSEDPKEYTLQSSSLPATETDNHYRTIWHKILHHFKWTDAILKTKELTKSQEYPSIFLIASNPLDEKQQICSLEAENVTNCIHSPEVIHSACMYANSYDDRRHLSKSYTENLHFQSRILFKGKFSSDYKISIAKLRKTFMDNFLKKHYSFNANLQKLPIDNVKLLSFKKTNCIVCSTFVGKIIHSKPHLHNLNNNEYLSISNLILDSDICKINHADLNVAQNSEKYLCLPNEIIAESAQKTNYVTAVLSKCEDSESALSTRGACDYTILNLEQQHTSLVSTSLPSLLESSDQSNSGCGSSSDSLPVKSPWQRKVGKCCFGWFRLHADPMFMVIASTMSLHTFVVVCMITIIEDFAKDLHVPDNTVHYVLMALSTADLVGALTMGIITDQGIISRCYFIVLCFFGTGVSIIALSFSQNLTMLLTLVAFYGIFETGVIITFPLLIAQFIEVKKQAVALASSNALSSPTVLLVPLVIEIGLAAIQEYFTFWGSHPSFPASFGSWLRTSSTNTIDGAGLDHVLCAVKCMER
ncbi:MFS domain-containing protein [Trichonephila inaurata madagascariensis]|uniref:MFS domain-containing protein n=1 Tax=Trichonephila inaurata madagascariensis TaxID=2747483 RepID=A0A8X6X3X0_9ARAC|nr:MFS domain-containing protein [Trichonephila inaurata madagascariensis]